MFLLQGQSKKYRPDYFNYRLLVGGIKNRLKIVYFMEKKLCIASMMDGAEEYF